MSYQNRMISGALLAAILAPPVLISLSMSLRITTTLLSNCVERDFFQRCFRRDEVILLRDLRGVLAQPPHRQDDTAAACRSLYPSMTSYIRSADRPPRLRAAAYGVAAEVFWAVRTDGGFYAARLSRATSLPVHVLMYTFKALRQRQD